MDFNLKINYEDITEKVKEDLKIYINKEFEKKERELTEIVEYKKEQEKQKALVALDVKYKEQVEKLKMEYATLQNEYIKLLTETIAAALDFNDEKTKQRTQKAMKALLNKWNKEQIQ